MADLHPSFWRTCRVLANENRLKLLWKLFQTGESSVIRLGESVGLSESVASTYLRALNSRGLIQPRRYKTTVLYRIEANPEVEGADKLLRALKNAYDNYAPVEMVFKSVTSFTHERRIKIVRVLSGGGMDQQQLSIHTGISPPALYRHIKKLKARGIVQKRDEIVYLLEPKDAFCKELLSLAVVHGFSGEVN